MTLQWSRPYWNGCQKKWGDMIGGKLSSTKPFAPLGTPNNPMQVEVTNFPPDYEYVSNTICDSTTDTWHYITTPFVDWVAWAPVDIDSGVSCDEVAPSIDIEKIEYCNTTTNTLWIKVCRFTTTYTDGEPNASTEEILSDTDTWAPCAPRTQVVRDRCRNGTIHDVVFEIDENGELVELSETDTWEACVITTVDVEYVCNSDTDLIEQYVHSYSNWVEILGSPVITPTAIRCEDIDTSKDYEQVRICDTTTGTVHIITTAFLQDDTSTQIGDFDTLEVCTPPVKQIVNVKDCDLNDVQTQVDSVVKVDGVIQAKLCPEDKIEVDVEYFCDSDSEFIQESITTTTNGTPVTVITPTTYACEDYILDFEKVVVCDADTKTKHVITSVFDRNENEVVIGNVDTEEPCCQGSPECVESQEWTYGIDNTGTLFSEDNTIQVNLSDGSSFTFNQPPATGWTPQMQVWWDEIQAAADANGIAWFVETRFRDPSNPTSLAGGGWFAGPPSVAVSNALTNMAWRYVNIQICPGQPVPVSAEIIASSNPNRVGFQLTSDGAVLWPIQKFIICRCCGEAPVWYLEDGVTLATAGQIPNCYEPCGTLSLVSSPPDRDCTFEIDVACDNNNSTNIVDFTNTITRRATVCNGEQIAVNYFQSDPNDPNALIEYTLVWDFVDCATWESIELPTTEWVIVNCSDEILPETFDYDVRLVGSKNPIAVYQTAQCGEYLRTEDIKLCEVDARFLLLIDSNGVFARYSFITQEWSQVNTLSVPSAWGSADVDNFLLYNFVLPDQVTVVDVNTDTQLPNLTLIDGVINPAVTTNPKNFAAASFRDSDGYLYAWDTAWADAWLYRIDVNAGTWNNDGTATIDFVTTITWVSWTGTSMAIDNTTDSLYINWSAGRVYSIDWGTGVGTLFDTAPTTANGSTFDRDGNLYVSSANNTYVRSALTGEWTLIIDDFWAGANSIAYYEVQAKKPSCFFRRYGITEGGDREIIWDFNVTDDSPRTVTWEVDCCECSCGGWWDETSGGWSTEIVSQLYQREVCVDTGTDIIEAYAIVEITWAATTLIRLEDNVWNVVTWTVVDCECPCD